MKIIHNQTNINYLSLTGLCPLDKYEIRTWIWHGVLIKIKLNVSKSTQLTDIIGAKRSTNLKYRLITVSLSENYIWVPAHSDIEAAISTHTGPWAGVSVHCGLSVNLGSIWNAHAHLLRCVWCDAPKIVSSCQRSFHTKNRVNKWVYVLNFSLPTWTAMV